MQSIKALKAKWTAIALCSALLAAASACSKSESYSNLLKKEEKATNWFLAQKEVETEIPADSVFKSGENAPFYKMDEDGYLYMQVVDPGTPEKKATQNQQIYFRYLRTNIRDMYEGLNPKPVGNANTIIIESQYASANFRFGNDTYSSSITYGDAVQEPLKYLGTDCVVNLVVHSTRGFNSEVGQCIPWLMTIRYFPVKN